MTTPAIQFDAEWHNVSEASTPTSSQAPNFYGAPATRTVAGTHGAQVLHFQLPSPPAIRGDADFDAFLAEMEADPAGAQSLAEGRQWVAEQFYEGAHTLARLRLAAGLSQKQLGEAIGMKQEHISRYETGRQEPGIGTAHAIAQALGVDLNTYFKAWTATRAQQENS
jgi:DNA-binding XRE family transcriptional regulator